MTPETRATLEDFVARAKHVESLSIFKNRDRIAGFTVRWEGEEAKFEYFHPSDEQRDALLFNLRLFVQDKDDISLRRLTELYRDPGVSDEWKQDHARLRAILNERLDTIAVEGPKGALSHGALFRMVLYGALAHRDVDHESYRLYKQWVTDEGHRAMTHDTFWQVVVWILATVINVARISQRKLSR
jgi:hypothetical protein